MVKVVLIPGDDSFGAAPRPGGIIDLVAAFLMGGSSVVTRSCWLKIGQQKLVPAGLFGGDEGI